MSGPVLGRMIPRHDAREGVLDAELIAIVSHQTEDDYGIQEVFLGDGKPVDSIHIPGFKLVTLRPLGPDIIEPITPQTRILIFLKRKKEDLKSWEPTAYGYCFYWVQDSSGVSELRNTALQAVQMRRQFEQVTGITDPQRRVEALYPFLWDHGANVSEHAKEELIKAGPVAGNYIADRLESMTPFQREKLIRVNCSYGGEKLHAALLRHLLIEQNLWDDYVNAHGSDPRSSQALWEASPEAVRNADGEIADTVSGLKNINDRADLPVIRQLALWAVKRDLGATCSYALGAFRDMPDPANLPVIDALWKESRARPEYFGGLYPYEVGGALINHRFPEAIPQLVEFLNGDFVWADQIEDSLTAIVGRDLGQNPKAWLEWYAAHQP